MGVERFLTVACLILRSLTVASLIGCSLAVAFAWVQFRIPNSTRLSSSQAALRIRIALPCRSPLNREPAAYPLLSTVYWVLDTAYLLLIYPINCRTAVGIWLAIDST